MLAILQTILALGGKLLAAEPTVVAIVKDAIAAFEARDQAGLDAAHQAALALADALAPGA